MTRKPNSNAKSLQEENDSLKKEKQSLNFKFGQIATAFKFHEASCVSHNQHAP